jgi:hypothetical protein
VNLLQSEMETVGLLKVAARCRAIIVVGVESDGYTKSVISPISWDRVMRPPPSMMVASTSTYYRSTGPGLIDPAIMPYSGHEQLHNHS